MAAKTHGYLKKFSRAAKLWDKVLTLNPKPTLKDYECTLQAHQLAENNRRIKELKKIIAEQGSRN